jgi:arsenite transporter
VAYDSPAGRRRFYHIGISGQDRVGLWTSNGPFDSVYGVYLIISGLLARFMAWSFKLPPFQGRVLAFSFGTRNSFVVLPLVLALPVSFEVATVAVVFQSLVELFGMAIYLWWVPRHLFPAPVLDPR